MGHIEPYTKEVSIEELEKLCEQLDFYPRRVGNGLWEIAKGVYTGIRGLEMFDRVLKNNVNSKKNIEI